MSLYSKNLKRQIKENLYRLKQLNGEIEWLELEIVKEIRANQINFDNSSLYFDNSPLFESLIIHHDLRKYLIKIIEYLKRQIH